MVSLTLTEKASFAALAAAFLLVCLPFGLSYVRNEPFVFYGKEFGFGISAYQKTQSDLATCQQQLNKTVVDALALVEKLKSENQQLKVANSTLMEQEESRKQKMSRIWFPVDDVTFYSDGKFVTQDGVERRGTWSHRNSELTLKLVSMEDDALVLATNLAAPGNVIRISTSMPLLVPMTKFDYQLSISSTITIVWNCGLNGKTSNACDSGRGRPLDRALCVLSDFYAHKRFMASPATAATGLQTTTLDR